MSDYCKCNAVPVIHFLKLTWIRLFPQSATMIFPLASTATPVGALNWPFPSPCEPNLNKNSPSALYTCQVRLSIKENRWMMLTSKEKCQSHPHSMRSTAVFGLVWVCLPFLVLLKLIGFKIGPSAWLKTMGGNRYAAFIRMLSTILRFKKPAK